MKRFASSLLFAAMTIVPSTSVLAQSQTPADMPWFMQMMPEATHEAAWNEYKAVYDPNSAVPLKYKQLIALAVSAQIPCSYCIYAHSKNAEKNGATPEEVSEALAVAALVRKWSTMLNGAQVDLDKFKAAVDGAPSN